jgi:hypothetical protein
MAYQSRDKAIRNVVKRLRQFRLTIEEMSAAHDQYGEVKFGEGAQLAKQQDLYWLLFRASIKGD